MINVKPYRVSNGILVLLLALATFQVNAQVKISNSGPGKNTVFFPGSDGYGIGYHTDLNVKIKPSTDGGLVKGTALAVIKNPSGNALALTATSRAPAAAVGAALGKFAGKVIGPLAVGVALYDLGKELGFIFDNSTGEIVVTNPGSSYTWKTTAGLLIASSASDPTAGWKAWVLSAYGSQNNATCGAVTGTTNKSAFCTSTYNNQTVESSNPITTNSPSTVSAFQNAVTAKTDWPANSNVSRALEQAQKDYDIFVEYNPPTVTGPATTPGKVSTSTSSTGTTTTSTTTHNHQYDGANVTTSNVTVNQTTNIAGDTTTTTTTETPAKEDEPQPDQCEKNPDSIACLELGTPTDQQLKTQSIGVSLTPVQFASSATCPADMSASFVVLGQSFNPKISYGPLCSAATDYIRPVLLLLALAGSAFIFVGGLKSGG